MLTISNVKISSQAKVTQW